MAAYQPIPNHTKTTLGQAPTHNWQRTCSEVEEESGSIREERTFLRCFCTTGTQLLFLKSKVLKTANMTRMRGKLVDEVGFDRFVGIESPSVSLLVLLVGNDLERAST